MQCETCQEDVGEAGRKCEYWDGKCGIHCSKHIEELLTKYEMWQPSSGRPFLCVKHMRAWWRTNYGNLFTEVDLKRLYRGKFSPKEILTFPDHSDESTL